MSFLGVYSPAHNTCFLAVALSTCLPSWAPAPTPKNARAVPRPPLSLWPVCVRDAMRPPACSLALSSAPGSCWPGLPFSVTASTPLGVTARLGAAPSTCGWRGT